MYGIIPSVGLGIEDKFQDHYLYNQQYNYPGKISRSLSIYTPESCDH